MKNILLTFGMIVGIILLLATVIYVEASMWNECRETNSFLYCLRVLSK